ncbi:MAG: nucleotidyltransferase domain-containing protein [Desulfobacteraceae bacterium]|jgi:predicted nucleotidyltransferase
MVDTKIREMINELVNLLKANGIKVEKTLLYGSYASGLSHVDSDVDVAIVSPDFGKDRFEERKFLYKLAWQIDPRISPIPISKEAFIKDTWIPLIHEIKQKGVEVRA